MLINKNKKCNQTCHQDTVKAINEDKRLGGKSFADKVDIIYMNWLDIKGKTLAEIVWNDMTGKTLLKDVEIIKEKLDEA